MTLPRQDFLSMFDALSGDEDYSVFKYLSWWNMFYYENGSAITRIPLLIRWFIEELALNFC